MKLIITHRGPSNGGETVVEARDIYDNSRNVDRVEVDRPMEAVQELAEWCERWGMPTAARRLRSDLVEHVEALDTHEEKLIDGLVRTRARRQAMVDGGGS